MPTKIARITCYRKESLPKVPPQAELATLLTVDKETIGQRIERLRPAKGWKRPQLGREMAVAIGRKKPFTGELIRLYEIGKNRPKLDARRALAKVFGRDESYIEFGPRTVREISDPPAREPGAAYTSGLSEEAIEVARAFDRLEPQGRDFIREQVFIYTVIDKSFPWLRHGKPIGTTYQDFERWHEENIAAKRDLDEQEAGRRPRSMREKVGAKR